MKLKFSFALIISLVHLQLAAQSKFFSVKGKEIISPEGKPFLIKGTNLGNWMVPEGYMLKLKNVNSPKLINEGITELIGPAEARKFWKNYLDNYITAPDIHYLKTLGMNSIRVPFNYRLFTKEDYLDDNDDQRGFRLFDRLIGYCKKEKLYLILDMHCAPGGQTGDNIDDSYGYPFLFQSEDSKQLTINIWRNIAKRYQNEEMIIGYDLLNEPIATYFDSAHFNPMLRPLYKRIVGAIREVDKNHLVFLGGAQWDSNFGPIGPPFDSKSVYTFHKYWSDTTQQVIQQYLDFRDKYNVPVYIGETGENTDQWIEHFRRLLERNNIGWHFWPYKKMQNTRGIVQFKKPENYDTVISYLETPKLNFEAIRKARPHDLQQVKKALMEVLKNCRFENCTANEGYISALGLKRLE